MAAASEAATLGAFPWVDADIRLAVRHLTPAQREAYIRLVRAQYRADVRERAHTILETDLGGDATGVHDARTARAMAGAGGGHKRGRDERPEDRRVAARTRPETTPIRHRS